MINRLFPNRVDNGFEGHRAALWLLGLFIALKLGMGVNSIFNTESVAVGADGIPLDSFGPAAAGQVLRLFALTALGQLTLAMVALTVLVRYRALVPFIALVLLGDQVARRLIAQSYAVVRTEGSPGGYITLALFGLLTLVLLLSLVPRRRRDRTSDRR